MSKPRALVVDDVPVNVRLASYVLSAKGIEVLAAGDAASAMAILETEIAEGRGRPDVVLMDVQLPEVDGLTFTRRLRADERFRTMPIVAVTAYAMASDRQAAEDAGCDGFVSKPIDTRSLAELVLRMIAEAPPKPAV